MVVINAIIAIKTQIIDPFFKVIILVVVVDTGIMEAIVLRFKSLKANLMAILSLSN